MKLPKILHTISSELATHQARAIVVGGSVRDYFLHIGAKDYDIEVFGLGRLETLENILQHYGKVKLVGKSFGVLKFLYRNEEYDFSFPRSERKVAMGHKGFDVSIDGSMSFKEAAKRRDFTINAMGFDIQKQTFLDPFGGREDLEQKILRHINDETFVEDPLRVYRGVQFCARFGLTMDVRTKALCSKMIEEGALEELPKERLFEEIKKLLLKADKPSIGWILLKELGALKSFPELDSLSQSQWVSTMKRLDLMVGIRKDLPNESLTLMLSALCLDLGELQSREFLMRLTAEVKLVTSVCSLLPHYRYIFDIYKSDESSAKIRKLSTKVKIEDLVLLAKADMGALGKDGSWCDRLWSDAKDLGVLQSSPEPFLQGRDLVREFGLEPSPKFKEILDKVYMMQLEGKITTKQEALDYIKGIL